jgi:HTH-type transcriptional regulator, competence development regulator
LSPVEREQENPPRRDLVFEAGCLSPDLRGDIKAVVTLYRRSRDARNSTSK